MAEHLVNNCINCPVAWLNFRNLSVEELGRVNENRFEAAFKPGEVLIREGLPATNAIFLSQGIAKAFVGGNGRPGTIMEIMVPGNLIIGPGVQVEPYYTFSVSALTPVRACFISFEVINQLVNTNADFAAGMIRDLSLKSLHAHKHMISLTQKKMAGRLAEAILFLSEKVFKSLSFDVLLTRQELGDYTNMAKESVVRILRELEGDGVIRTGNSFIEILDLDKLRNIAING